MTPYAIIAFGVLYGASAYHRLRFPSTLSSQYQLKYVTSSVDALDRVSATHPYQSTFHGFHQVVLSATDFGIKLCEQRKSAHVFDDGTWLSRTGGYPTRSFKDVLYARLWGRLNLEGQFRTGQI
jgi:hypothetical protein